jgi:hypothetical protein
MYAKTSFIAWGHELIKASHKKTFEITKDEYLTERGDCIIAIKSEKACSDLDAEVVKIIKNDESLVKITLECQGIHEEVLAHGSSKLLLSNNRSIVVRKSDYIDDRTLAIKANKAAADFDRSFIRIISKRDSKIMVTIEVFLQKFKPLL